MTVKVFNVVHDVQDNPVPRCPVEVRVWDEQAVYQENNTTLEVSVRTRADNDAKWLLELVPETLYEFIEAPRQGEYHRETFLTPADDAGAVEHYVGDLLTDPPGAPATSALLAHIQQLLADGAHGGDEDSPGLPAGVVLLDVENEGASLYVDVDGDMHLFADGDNIWSGFDSRMLALHAAYLTGAFANIIGDGSGYVDVIGPNDSRMTFDAAGLLTFVGRKTGEAFNLVSRQTGGKGGVSGDLRLTAVGKGGVIRVGYGAGATEGDSSNVVRDPVLISFDGGPTALLSDEVGDAIREVAELAFDGGGP